MTSLAGVSRVALPAAPIGGRQLAGLSLALASGACGLAWQFIWTQQLSNSLGHEIVAVLAVLGAFFGGLAIGAWALRRVIERSARPALWYGGLELLIAGWGLGLSLLLPALTPGLGQLIGAEPSAWRHWGLAFFLPLLLLLPVTAAMGATLPALERCWRGAGSSLLSALYSANTLGAVLGTLGVVFVAIPQLGLQATALACAALNLVCGLSALALNPGQRSAVAQAAAVTPAPARGAGAAEIGRRHLLLLLAGSGLLGIGYEVLAVRVLSQVTENTVYSYALLLAVYLLGTAAGAAWHQRAQGRLDAGQAGLARLLGWLVLTTLAGGLSLWAADRIVILPARWFGPGAASALAGEALAAAVAMGPPTWVMGIVFAQLCHLARANQMTLGGALAVNTAAAALAPWLVGVGLIPALGARAALLLIAAGYLALMPGLWRRGSGFWLPLVLLALMAALTPPLRFVDLPPGGRVLSYRDGVMAAVSVVEDGRGVARLHINNRVQEGSSASGAIEMRLALLPLQLHPKPRQALFLGLGTGYTVQVAARDPGLRVDGVELLPEVIEAAPLFVRTPNDQLAGQPGLERVHAVAADARRYVLAAPQRYDVVIADLFHPARSGAGALYTREHFAAVRDRLAPGGLFCQWLALHQMDVETLRSIVAAYLAVFPEGKAVLASNSLDTPVLGLVARPGMPRFELDALRARLHPPQPELRQLLSSAGLDDEFGLLGSALAGSVTLQRFAQGAAVNSDDRPVVTHRAPWATYAPASQPRQRLHELISSWRVEPGEWLQPADPIFEQRLQRYWDVRRRYLELGLATVPDPDPVMMLDRLQQPLLGLLRDSPEFRPAADPLRALAAAVRPRDPGRADDLLRQLERLQPQRQDPALRP